MPAMPAMTSFQDVDRSFRRSFSSRPLHRDGYSFQFILSPISIGPRGRSMDRDRDMLTRTFTCAGYALSLVKLRSMDDRQVYPIAINLCGHSSIRHIHTTRDEVLTR